MSKFLFRITWIVFRVKPVKYKLSLYNIELGGRFSYQGTVKIEVEVKKSTKKITLNCIDIEIFTAVISSGDGAPRMALCASRQVLID